MKHRPIFYDTETTGISPERDRVIELAAYDPFHDRSFVQLINPGRSIPPEATAIHKITDNMVSACPNFGDVARQFIEFCQGDVILIAHNNDSFDLQFMKQEFTRNQVAMPEWKFLDSLKWARRYRPDLPRHTLQFLREMYGIPANTAHRALDDVIVLHKVFSLMTDDLPINQIFDLINRPREITTMPFGKYQGKSLSELPQDYVDWLANNGALDKAENQQLRSKLQALGKIK